MNNQKPNEILQSLSYFFVYPEVSERLIKEIDNKIDSLRDSMQFINTKEGLIKYISDDPDSLGNITMVLNVSEEYFKRIVTLLRARHGLEVSNEWSLAATRNFFLSNQWFRDALCELFLYGAENKELAEVIPSYNLRAFRIDATTIARLSNRDLMGILLKKDMDSQFSTECSQRNIRRIDETLVKICEKEELFLNRDVSLKLAGKREQIPYAISRSKASAPFVYIMMGFYLTTGSTQTSFVTKISRLKAYIRDNSQEAAVVCVVDGAGWIARRSDFDELFEVADQVYTLNSFAGIGELIDELKQ